jgi:MFS family permease
VSEQTPPSLPRLVIGTLGMVTIVAYGACYYAFGVLIEPIHAGTGWSLAKLGAVFSAVLVVNGAFGILGGRLSDRVGTRFGFLAAALLGAGGMLASSYQNTFVGFAACYAAGCGLVGALGFYHITQPAAARAHPDDPSRGIVWLTILGVFASPIYLPATAKLIQLVGWRATIRIEAASVGVAFLFAAAVVGGGAARAPAEKLERARDAITTAWRSRAFRAWVGATLIGGAAADIMLVYQVPAMIAAGLPITLAATFAGARGFAQLAGRIPLTPTIRRLGARRTVVVANFTAGIGAVLLLASGNLAIALTYSVLAGASLGALSTLQGIYTSELVDGRHLSMLMGAQQAVFSIGGAAGPVVAGALIDATGNYTVAVLAVAAGFGAAGAILLMSPPRADA